MNAHRSPRLPSYRLHKPSGQAVVTLAGKDHYLGAYGSPASKAAYERLLAQFLASGRQTPTAPPSVAEQLAVGEVADRFLTWAEGFYRQPDGTVSRAVDNLRIALRPLVELFLDAPAAEFGPRSLMLYRDRLIGDGLSRKVVNERVGIVKRAFKWAAREEIVPATVWHSLGTVDGLRRGRCGVRESKPVRPALKADIDAALPHMPPMVRAMVQLQLLTAARPGEIVVLRMCDVDRSDAVWLYRPTDHKNAWRDQKRCIALGPRCQEILRPFIRPGCDRHYLFSPSESERGRRATLRAARKTPLWPSHLAALDRKRRSEPRRAPRDRYDVMTYGRAVRRACERAGVPVWSPGQLRHNAATELRKRYGLDVAAAVLGHRKVETTQIYAERDLATQLEIARRVG